MAALPATDASGEYASAANFEYTAGEGRVGVVLLHGLGGDLTQPRDYTGGIIDGRAATRLAADARLHGLTDLDGPEPLTFNRLATDIVALADHLTIPADRVYVGVSMGAATALTVALQAPSQVRALVLIRPAWLQAPHPPNLAAFALIARLLTRYGPVDGQARMRRTPLWQHIDRESRTMAASLLSQFSQPLAQQRVRRLLEIPSDRPFTDPTALSALDIPTLVIGAPGDPVHPLHIAEQCAQWLPTARYAQITGRDLDANRHRIDLRRTVDGFLATL
jgi:pimeloyl-ACP methyl ester carboxylesterase